MTTAKVYAQGSYGAFELKRCYQKNMIAGTLISGALPLLIIAILAFVGYITVTEVGVIPVSETGLDTIFVLPPPINIDINPPPISIDVKPVLPKFATDLRPVEDNQEMPVMVIATGLQKIDIINSGVDTGAVQGVVNGVYTPGEIIGEIIPEPTEFIPRTDEPILLDAPAPNYPEMARQIGMQGTVWMQIYVDKNGDVRDARVIKSSNSNAGFEEEALAAAWKRKYRPAMQNDQPVGVWISYKVSFKLH